MPKGLQSFPAEVCFFLILLNCPFVPSTGCPSICSAFNWQITVIFTLLLAVLIAKRYIRELQWGLLKRHALHCFKTHVYIHQSIRYDLSREDSFTTRASVICHNSPVPCRYGEERCHSQSACICFSGTTREQVYKVIVIMGFFLCFSVNAGLSLQVFPNLRD